MFTTDHVSITKSRKLLLLKIYILTIDFGCQTVKEIKCRPFSNIEIKRISNIRKSLSFYISNTMNTYGKR